MGFALLVGTHLTALTEIPWFMHCFFFSLLFVWLISIKIYRKFMHETVVFFTRGCSLFDSD